MKHARTQMQYRFSVIYEAHSKYQGILNQVLVLVLLCLHVNNMVPDWGIKDQGGDHPEDNCQEGDLTQVLVPEQVQERDSASVPTKKNRFKEQSSN